MQPDCCEKYAQFQNYSLIKFLGKGGFGKVKLGRDNLTGQLRAIKLMKKTENQIAQAKVFQSFSKEYQLLKNLDHKNIVKFYDFVQEGIYKKKNDISYRCAALILQYLPSYDLFQIMTLGNFTETLSRTIFQQMIDGMTYLHKNSIAHRDIKLQNFLFDKDLNVKITDFGLAKIMTSQPKTQCGTKSYQSPQLVLKSPYNGIANDVFALGVVLFIMVTGRPPFNEAHPKNPHYQLLVNCQHAKFWAFSQKGLKQKLSPQLKSFLGCLFSFDPTLRPTLSQIKQHPWYKGDIQMMDGIIYQLDVLKVISQRRAVVQEGMMKQKAKKLEKKKGTNTAYKKFRGIDDGLEGEFSEPIYKKAEYGDLRFQKNQQSIQVLLQFFQDMQFNQSVDYKKNKVIFIYKIIIERLIQSQQEFKADVRIYQDQNSYLMRFIRQSGFLGTYHNIIDQIKSRWDKY